MATQRKNETLEDFKKRRDLYNKEYRDKNKDSISEYNKQTREHQNKKRNLLRNSVFYVYKHTNSKGDVYIGSGNKSRPNEFHDRIDTWKSFFKNDCTVKIIKEFKTREEARSLESDMIQSIGLQNLVNQRS